MAQYGEATGHPKAAPVSIATTIPGITPQDWEMWVLYWIIRLIRKTVHSQIPSGVPAAIIMAAHIIGALNGTLFRQRCYLNTTAV